MYLLNVCMMNWMQHKEYNGFEFEVFLLPDWFPYCCDADQRKTQGTQKVWWKNIYIQVTETRFKWTWLNSC